MAPIDWLEDADALLAAARRLEPAIAGEDAAIARATSVRGDCPACGRPTTFQVSTGAAFAGRPNLREGLRCVDCRLTARQRLMLLAIAGEVARRGIRSGVLLEKASRLYRACHARWPWLQGTEYLGDGRSAGRRYWWSARGLRWYRIRHESITALSFADASLQLLAHSDVLEHVYDVDRALAESARVLVRGGVTLFTVPFRPDLPHSILRGRPRANGDIEHFEPPEYHGDTVRSGGIYTFHTFGQDLLGRIRAAGFSRVETGLCHAPALGFAAADPGAAAAWTGVPLVFRAVR